MTQERQPQESPAAYAGEWKLIAAVVIFAASGLILISTPAVRDRLWSPGTPSAPLPTFDEARDPALGTKVELPEADLFGRPLVVHTANPNSLLVLAGPCSECSLDSLKVRSIDHRLYRSVILVYTGDKRLLSAIAKNLPKEYRVLFDDGSMHEALNAPFQPRFMVLDGDDKLIKLQEKYAETPEFVRYAK